MCDCVKEVTKSIKKIINEEMFNLLILINNLIVINLTKESDMVSLTIRVYNLDWVNTFLPKTIDLMQWYRFATHNMRFWLRIYILYVCVL